MNRDATTITAAHETTSDRMTLDSGMSGVHHRGVEIIVTKCAFHIGRGQCHAKKEAAIAATTTVREITTPMTAIEDRQSDSDRVKATAVTSAKRQSISKLRGASKLLDTA